jgi:Domain of unknown function (DUF5063)
MSLRTHPAVVRFVEAARTYCRLIESRNGDREQWVESVLSALAQLYAAALLLPEPDGDQFSRVPDSFRMSHAEWQELWQAIGRLLGEARWYWAYFDPTAPPTSELGPVEGDLADDLADIYRDIKGGLLAWEAGEDRWVAGAVYDWKWPGLQSHWGVHAVGALRALHPLAFLRGLGEREQDEMDE